MTIAQQVTNINIQWIRFFQMITLMLISTFVLFVTIYLLKRHLQSVRLRSRSSRSSHKRSSHSHRHKNKNTNKNKNKNKQKKETTEQTQ